MAWKLARYEPYSIESMWNQLKDEILHSMSQYHESSTDRDVYSGVVFTRQRSENVHDLIKEMPKRVKALKNAKGSQTKYYRGVELFNFKCFFYFDLVLLYLQVK